MVVTTSTSATRRRCGATRPPARRSGSSRRGARAACAARPPAGTRSRSCLACTARSSGWADVRRLFPSALCNNGSQKIARQPESCMRGMDKEHGCRRVFACTGRGAGAAMIASCRLVDGRRALGCALLLRCVTTTAMRLTPAPACRQTASWGEQAHVKGLGGSAQPSQAYSTPCWLVFPWADPMLVPTNAIGGALLVPERHPGLNKGARRQCATVHGGRTLLAQSILKQTRGKARRVCFAFT